MTNIEFLTLARKVMREAEDQGFTGTAEAMKQVIASFEQSMRQRGLCSSLKSLSKLER